MLQSSSTDVSDQKPRACQNCFKSKSKCVPLSSDPNSKCSRCSRLNKECATLPKKSRRRKSPARTVNIGHLEQRIESLVSLLSNAEGVVAKQNHLTPPESQSDAKSSASEITNEGAEKTGADINLSSTLPRTSWNNQFPSSLAKSITLQGQPPPATRSPNIQDGKLFNQEFLLGVTISERPFEVYRRQFDLQMPFSFIPPGISPYNLQIQKPWLYRTCSMVGMFDDKGRQTEIAENIILEISQGMLLRGEKSIDMLQSLLIYNAWSYHYARIYPSKKSHADFSLAIAMLYDLGLPKKAPDNDGPAELLSESMVKEVPENSSLEKRSAEERRVLLACYLLASVYSLCVRKIDMFPTYSPYIGYCCERILAEPHQENDLLLVSIIKLQSKMEAFYRSLPAKESSEEIKAPLWMHVKSVQADCENYWLSLPASIKENFFMILHYRTARVLLYEPSLQKTLFPTVPFESSNSRRLDMLYACLIASQEATEHFLTQPLQFFATMPMLLLSHLGHTLSTLLKLSMIEEPGWDLDHIRQTANVRTYFEEFIRRFEDVGASLDRYKPSSHSMNSMSTMCSRGLRKLKAWYESKIAVEPNASNSPQTTATNTGIDFNMDIDFFDLNDTYWLDLMSENSLQ